MKHIGNVQWNVLVHCAYIKCTVTVHGVYISCIIKVHCVCATCAYCLYIACIVRVHLVYMCIQNMYEYSALCWLNTVLLMESTHYVYISCSVGFTCNKQHILSMYTYVACKTNLIIHDYLLCEKLANERPKIFIVTGCHEFCPRVAESGVFHMNPFFRFNYSIEIELYTKWMIYKISILYKVSVLN